MSALTPDPILAFALSNIAADRFLSDSLKAILTERMQTTVPSHEAWGNICIEPRSDALRDGLRQGAEPEEEYGHVSLKGAFLRHLARTSGADYRQLEMLLEGLRGTDPIQDRTEALTEWQLLVGHIPLRQRPEIWLFGLSGLRLNDIQLTRLPCCLGLIHGHGDVFLGFEMSRAALSAIRATCVLDATWDYLPLWRAAGSTEPNCVPRLPSDLGFNEYLAQSPTIGHVNSFTADILAA